MLFAWLLLHVLLFVFLLLFVFYSIVARIVVCVFNVLQVVALPPSPFPSGLVLSTDLSSLIYPLTKTGEASLEWLNEYLSCVTGIHLDYSKVVQEDPPLYRSRLHSLKTNHTPIAEDSGPTTPTITMETKTKSKH